MRFKKIAAMALTGTIMSLCVVANAQHMGTEDTAYGTEWEDYKSVPASNFSDVRGHWAAEWIDRAYSKGWIQGYPNNTFRPNAPINRGEVVTIFTKFMGIQPSLPETNYFSYTDASKNSWMIPYMESAKKLLPQYINGQGTPALEEQPITREDVIYALVVALRYDDKVQYADQSVLNMFTDRNSISAAIKPYVAVAVSNGLVSGYDDNTIGGVDPLTRAEFATLLGKASTVGYGTGLGMNSIGD